jgi:hypothetical protein
MIMGRLIAGIQANHPSGLRTQIDERIFDLLAPASA